MMFVIRVILVLVLPLCAAEKVHFFTRGESYGVTLDTGNGKREEVKCSIRSVVSSRREAVHEVSLEELKRLKRYCKDRRSLGTGTSKRNKRALINIIAPGTKWCGTGDIAQNYNDLGSNAATDACCRAHDGCSPSIAGFSSIGTFINVLPWTRLHCDCDNAFHSCLKEARKTEQSTADLVGNAYFNVLATDCFKETSFRICVKIGWFKCSEYKTFNTYYWKSTPSY